MPLRSLSELVHTIVNSAAGGTLAVVSGVAQQRASIYRMILMTGGTTNITIQDTNSGALSAPYPMVANGSIVLDISANGDPWFVSGVGLGLQINSSVAVQVSADVYTLQGP